MKAQASGSGIYRAGRRRQRRLALVSAIFAGAALLAFPSSVVRASDGIKPVANGARAGGRGGADLAVANDATAMNTNPAGIAQIRGYRLDTPLAVFVAPASFKNNMNDVKAKRKLFVIPNFGFVFDLKETGSSVIPYKIPHRTLFVDHNKKLLVLVPTECTEQPEQVDLRVRGRHATVSNVTVTAQFHLGEGEDAQKGAMVLARDPTPREIDSFEDRTIVSFRRFRPLPPEAVLERLTVYYDLETHFTNVGDAAEMSGDLSTSSVFVDGLERGRYSTALTTVRGQEIDQVTEITVRPELPGTFRNIDQVETNYFKYGIGFFVQGGAGAEWEIRSKIYPDGARNMSNFFLGSLTPTIAYRYSPDFMAGIAINLNASSVEFDTPLSQPADRMLQGQVLPAPFPPLLSFGASLKGLYNVPEITGQVQLRGTSVGMGTKFGVLWRWTDTLTFGSALGFKTVMYDYDGRVHLDFNRQMEYLQNDLDPTDALFGIPFSVMWPIIEAFLPNGGSDGYAADYDSRIKNFQFPREWGAGLRWDATDHLMLATDFKWIQWSDAFQTFKVELDNGDNPDVNRLVGDDGLEVNIPLNYRDQFTWGLGGEYWFNDNWVARAGYHYASNIVGEDYLFPIVPAIVTHHATAGFGYESESLSVNLSYEYGLENSIKSGSSRQSTDLNNSELSVSQHTVWFQFSYEF